MSDLINDTNNKKRGLGRGLGSLLGGATSPSEQTQNFQKNSHSYATTRAEMLNSQSAADHRGGAKAENKIWEISIERLAPGKYQPRKSFNKESISELAASIKENGVIQPIVARRNSIGKLEIVAGERRWRAAQVAGIHQVPVIIKEIEDKNALEMAIIENIQREDLNSIDEAEGYERLIREFNLNQQEIANKVGKERATIANALRLLALPEGIKAMIVNKEITAGHAKALLALSDTSRMAELAQDSVNQGLSVRKLEKLVQKINSNKEDISAKEKDELSTNLTNKLIEGLAEEMQKALGTKVTIDYTKAKGKINIHFYSDEELSNIVEKLRE